MGNKWLVFLTLLLVMGITSGCAQYSIHITEHQDGSALCEYRLGVSAMLLQLISPQGANPLEDWQQRTAAQGFTVQQRQQDHWVEYIASKQVTSLAEISPVNSPFVANEPTGNPFRIKTTVFSERLQLQEDIDLSGLWSGLPPEEAQLVQTLLKDVKIQFVFHTPRHILRHNADIVRHEANTNTLLWQLVPGVNNQISLTTQHMLVRHVAGVGALAAIMVYYTVMAVYLLGAQSPIANAGCAATANSIGANQQQKVPDQS